MVHSNEVKVGEIVRSDHPDDGYYDTGEVTEITGAVHVMLKIGKKHQTYHVHWLKKLTKLERALK